MSFIRTCQIITTDLQSSHPRRRQLPTELIEAILDHLYDDKKSLKVCSLVCKDWIHPARRLLFYKWTIFIPHYIFGRTVAEEVNQPLRISTALPFLRHLCIDSYRGPRDWNAILPLLVGSNHLRTVHLLSGCPYTLTSHSHTFSALVRTFSGVVNLCLEKVEFRGVLCLARLVCALPYLQALSIKRAVISDRSRRKSDRPPLKGYKPSPRLVALELDMPGMDNVLQWFLTLEVPHVFRSICLHHSRKNDPDVTHKFIASLDKSLEHLSFPICGTRTHYHNPRLSLITYRKSEYPHLFDLSHLTQLRSIQITLYDWSCTSSLTDLLSCISSAHLERLAFCVTSPHENNGTGTILQWNQVDDTCKVRHSTDSKRCISIVTGRSGCQIPSCVICPIVRTATFCRFASIDHEEDLKRNSMVLVLALRLRYSGAGLFGVIDRLCIPYVISC
jgi:hypothetical protein